MSDTYYEATKVSHREKSGFLQFGGVSLKKPFQNDRYLLVNLLVCKKFAILLPKSLGDF